MPNSNILLKENGVSVFPIIKDIDQIYHNGVLFNEAISSLKKEIVSAIYPVGSILMLDQDLNPNTLTQGIYWSKISTGKILVSEGYLDNNSTNTLVNSQNGPTGEYTVAINFDTMPTHSHPLYHRTHSSGDLGWDYGGSGSNTWTHNTGGWGSHLNIMPYKTVNIWERVPEIAKGQSLEKFSWAQIKQIASQGKASEYWKVGDSKTVSFGGNTLTFHIVDFREEKISADDSYIPGIVFEAYSSIKPNLTPDCHYKTWTQSNIYNYFEDVMLKLIPEDLAASIVPVYKSHIYFNASSAPSSSTLEEVPMKLWLSSAKERGATATEYKTTEDRIFSYYSGIAASAAKRGKNYLWRASETSATEILRSNWYNGSGYVFFDTTTHTFSGTSVSGTLNTHINSTTNPNVDNTYLIAPCFFIG